MAYVDPEHPALTLCQSIFFFCKGMIEGVVAILFLWLFIQVLLNKHQQVHLQVLLGGGLALLCFCLLLGCAVCWRRSERHNQSSRKEQAPTNTLVELGPALPSQTTTVPIQQQYVELEGEMLECAGNDSLGSPGAGSLPQSMLHGRASLPSIPFSQKLGVFSKIEPGWERRSTISGETDESSLLTRPYLGPSVRQSSTMPRSLSSAGPKQQPQLHFILFYSQPEATLTVTVISVSHLPKGFRSSRDSYVKVYLLPKFIEPQRTAVRRKSLNPEFREQFQFGRYHLEELRGFTLRFAVYVKEFRSFRDSFVGEVMFPCAQVTWNPEAASSYTRELSTTKTKLKKCLSAQDMSYGAACSQSTSLGQLFILLQYQALANRIKVLVRKAENLGRLTRMPGAPDHYVVIHFYYNGRVMDTKETKSIAGYNPVWNTPFLFNVPAGDIQEQQLCLEFTIMQARLYTRSCTLGRVLIGPHAPESGLLHWKEMCCRGQVESARWHVIQPNVFSLSP
ncbi:synaptotagmin-5-like isoform X1 [Trachemys scripta elegans]|uniref:synaptotagmin-5-like isoform X1 n=1 Tax=Trachemys scripta elegans TaxID=31138 RepID=UPI0015557F55|nr:synaptotagmin-5-like isoform X1 [Trachemys scripta elegans]